MLIAYRALFTIFANAFMEEITSQLICIEIAPKFQEICIFPDIFNKYTKFLSESGNIHVTYFSGNIHIS